MHYASNDKIAIKHRHKQKACHDHQTRPAQNYKTESTLTTELPG